jgi:hypothetical protein
MDVVRSTWCAQHFPKHFQLVVLFQPLNNLDARSMRQRNTTFLFKISQLEVDTTGFRTKHLWKIGAFHGSTFPKISVRFSHTPAAVLLVTTHLQLVVHTHTHIHTHTHTHTQRAKKEAGHDVSASGAHNLMGLQ